MRWLLLHGITVNPTLRAVFGGRAWTGGCDRRAARHGGARDAHEGVVRRCSRGRRGDGSDPSRRRRASGGLARFYGGGALSRNVKDDNLKSWFEHIAKEVEKLVRRAAGAGRKVHQLVDALVDVEQFHQIDTNLQTKQYLHDIREHLQRMVKTVNVAEFALNTLAVVSDASYAWGVIGQHTEYLQERIRRDSTMVKKQQSLPQTQVHLAAAHLAAPQRRSVQRDGYYSSELVAYVRAFWR